MAVGQIQWGDNGSSEHVHMYEKQLDGSWVHSSTIGRPSDAIVESRGDSLFGTQLALYNNTLIVGAAYDGGSYKGRAYIYNKQLDDTWTITQTLQGQQAYDYFGSSMDLNNDLLVINSSNGNNSGTNTSGSGITYIYKKQADGIWAISSTFNGLGYSWDGGMNLTGSTLLIGKFTNNNVYEYEITQGVSVDDTETLFGGSTINFDGDGDYLSVGDRTTYSYLHDGTTDYTVECWVNFSTIKGLNPVIGTAGNSSTLGFSVYYAGGSNNEWRALIYKNSTGSSAARIDISDAPETDRWYHVAVVHTNNTLYFYIDGALGGSSSASSYPTSDSSFRELRLGSFESSPGYHDYSDCHIQDIRISKKAVYTSNFTPPTSLLPFCTFNTPTVIDTGSGYTTPGTDVPTTGGSGTGLKVSYDVGDDGGVKDPTITDDGTGYQDGDIVDIPGGTEPAKVVITTYTTPPAGTDTNSILFKLGRAIKTAQSLSAANLDLISANGSYQDFLNGYGNTVPDGGGNGGTGGGGGTDVQPEGSYVPDPYFDLNNFVDEVGAHHIYFLVPYTNTRTGTAIEHPAGTVFRTTGISTERTLIRAEDPDNPRDYPYTTHSTNISSGVWSWFNLSNRGTQWEFATTGTPTEAP
jgi:hypothetical protein